VELLEELFQIEKHGLLFGVLGIGVRIHLLVGIHPLYHRQQVAAGVVNRVEVVRVNYFRVKKADILL
jgi:hypothetical protein